MATWKNPPMLKYTTTNSHGMPHHVRKFNGLVDMVGYLDEDASDDDPWYQTRPSIDGDDEWAGGSLSDAKAMALTGDPTHAHKVTATVNGVLDNLRRHQGDTFQAVYDVAGGACDIDRFLTGEPECMVEWQLRPGEVMGKVAVIAVNIYMSADISHDQIIRQGVRLAALVEAFAEHGVNCEIWAEGSLGGMDRSSLSICTLIKSTADSLDLGQLLFTFANPMFCRRLSFAVMERENEAMRKNHGMYEGFRGGVQRHGWVDRSNTNADIVLESPIVGRRGNQYAYTQSDEDWIIHQMTQLGVVANLEGSI